MDLKKTAVSSILWSLWQQISLKMVSFCVTIYISRLLDPAEFGLIAMLSIFVAIGNSLVDSGLTSSLIRTSQATDKELSTVFYFNLAGSIVLYTMLFLAAPLIASFYNQPILVPVARVYGLIFISNGFFGIQNTLLTKEMNFRKQTNIQIPASVFGGIIGIWMAEEGYGVWSIVAMYLCNSFLSTALHWIYSSWRPTLVFDKAAFKNHFNFGYKITASGLLDTAYQNLYLIIIGKFFSASQLGLYSRADSISQLPISNISAAINKATYPLFAQVSQNAAQLKVMYKKLMQQVMFWNAPALVLLALIAAPLFDLLLSTKWMAAVPYFKLLCISGVMYPLHSYNLNVLKVMGQPALFLKIETVKKIISITGVFLSISYGIYGLLYFQLFFNLISYYLNSFYTGRLIAYPVKEQLADIMPIIITTTLCGLLCNWLTVRLFAHIDSSIMQISITIIMFIVFYGGANFLSKSTALNDFNQLILKR